MSNKTQPLFSTPLELEEERKKIVISKYNVLDASTVTE